MKFSVARTAIYESGESSHALKLVSPEHLAPVFLMWPNRRFVVDVACNEKGIAEVPLIDGSALPFFTELRRNVGVPEEIAFYDVPVHAEWDLYRTDRNESKPYGSVRITPSEAFEVEYVLDKGNGFKSAVSVSIYSAENLYNVLTARTFILKKEFDEAREAGLLGGVDESCGLLIDESVMGGELSRLYRVAEEPARHKILDLLGDLCFVKPKLPKVRLEIINGGHVSHRQIMEKIIPYAL